MECIVDTCLCGLLFYAIGFAFMFSHGNGLIGYNWFFLQDAPATYETTWVAFLASSHASAVTGAVITVDGGATAVDLPTIAYDPS